MNKIVIALLVSVLACRKASSGDESKAPCNAAVTFGFSDCRMVDTVWPASSYGCADATSAYRLSAKNVAGAQVNLIACCDIYGNACSVRASNEGR